MHVAHNNTHTDPYGGEPRLVQMWRSVQTFLQCLVGYVTFLWQHNPLRVLLQRQKRLYFVESYGEVMIQPRLKERILDLFLSDYRRRKRLLNWVHSRLRLTDVTDFSTCWNDGTVLCALLESICPGVCPSFHLLSQHNRVRNCRLGLKLANKYLYVPMDLLSPEELAIATPSSENRVIQYISLLKWASENIKEKWISLHKSLIAAKTGRCFVKGSGLRNGIVGKRSKFTIIVSDTIGVFNLLVEVRGPNNEYCGERIVSLHQAKGVLDNSFNVNHTYSDTIKYIEDAAGNCFIRKKIPARYLTDSSSDSILLDFQCGDEGNFYVTFVPRRAGLHSVVIKWHNHNVENSPFRVKGIYFAINKATKSLILIYKASNVSSKNMKGAHEKRVIYDHLSFVTQSNESQDGGQTYDVIKCDVPAVIGASEDGNSRSLTAMARAKAYTKGRQLTVTRRRVLRRIITRNGEDIVIEEAISPTLSRQSSITDNSDEDLRLHSSKKDKENRWSPCLSPVKISALKTVTEEKPPPRHEGDRKAQLKPRPARSLDSLDKKESKQKHSDGNFADDHAHKERVDIKHILDPESPIAHAQKTGSGATDRRLQDQHCAPMQVNARFTAPEHFTFVIPPTFDVTSSTNSFKVASHRRPSHEDKPHTAARRTSSDGTMYALRRDIVSFANSDVSESSSNMSSDSLYSPLEGPGDSITPSLKLLQSQSLTKSCVYMTNSTCIASADKQEADESKHRRERARELPIKRRMWQMEWEEDPSERHSDREPTVDGTSATAGKDTRLASRIDGHTRTGSSTDVLHDISAKTTAHGEGKPKGKTKGYSKGQDDDDAFCPSEKIINVKWSIGPSTDSTDDNECKQNDGATYSNISEAGSSQRDLTTLSDTKLQETRQSSQRDSLSVEDITSKYPSDVQREDHDKMGAVRRTICTSPNRANFQRQWTIGCDQGNGETMSLPTDSSEDNMLMETEMNGMAGTFQAISPSTYKEYTENARFHSDVPIVIPKAKVDKSTQVSDSEIIEATGWDLVKNLYYLMRRICIKVPCDVAVDDPAFPERRVANVVTNEPSQNINQATGAALDTGVTGADDSGRANDRDDEIKKNVLALPLARLEGLTLRSGLGEQKRYLGSYGNITAWFERNDRFHSSLDRLVPARQRTIDTVDSGYDDNPLNYHRMARNSLPSLRDGNGHIRLFRRPYSGRINLDPKLVCSASSVNSSGEGKELGNEADDELLPSRTSGATRHRRRQRLRYRQESVSMSDSELNERRRGFKSKTYMCKGSVSKTAKIETSLSFPEQTLVERPPSGSRKTTAKHWKKMIQRMDAPGVRDTQSDEVLDMKEDMIDTQEQPEIPLNAVDSAVSATAFRHRSWTRSNTSLDSSYSGFGISKPERRELLSQINEFQNLCPTDESIDGDDLFERIESIERDDFSSNVNETELDVTDEDGAAEVEDGDAVFIENSWDFLVESASSVSRRSGSIDLTPSFADSRSDYLKISESSLGNSSEYSKISDSCYLAESERVKISDSSVGYSEGDFVKVSDSSAGECDPLEDVPNDLVEETDNLTERKEHKGTSVEYQRPRSRDCYATSDDDNLQSCKKSDDDSLTFFKETLKRDADIVDATIGNVETSAFTYLTMQDLNGPKDTLADCTGKIPGTNTDSVGTSECCDSIREFTGAFLSCLDENTDVDVSTCDEDTPELLQTFDMFASFDLSHLSPRDPELPQTSQAGEEPKEGLSGVHVPAIHVAGAGLRYGQVGSSNSFQVWVENQPSTGALSVTVVVVGSRGHDVTQTSVIYTGDNLYEVSYDVTCPGFYKIYVKWGEFEAVDSPFICQVSL